jgi:hypothetical protein
LGEDETKVAVEVRIGTIRGDRPADVLGRGLVVSALVGDQAKEVQGVGVRGLHGQYLAVGGFSLSQAARLMVGEATL